MSDAHVADRAGTTRGRPDWAVFGVVFLMLFAFSYSEQLIFGLFRVIGRGDTSIWWLVLAVVDTAVLAAVGFMKVAITGRMTTTHGSGDGGGRDSRS
jgi:hypothetical protein